MIANLLQPFRDRALRDGFTHLRHYNFSTHMLSELLGPRASRPHLVSLLPDL
jgi:hypothetical protein